MPKLHKITILYQELNKTITHEVPDGEFILRSFESKGESLPFSCRNGCCSTCAVKIISGTLDQSLGIGLSKQMQDQGYALLCIAKANGPLVAKTQSDDEVYEKQFGKYLSGIKNEVGNPFDI